MNTSAGCYTCASADAAPGRATPTRVMPQASAESPKRAWLKAAEVCELAQVQPYVLRTWEMEFPDLGVAKSPGGPRVYRKGDVDRVLRIKQLVFGDGLTLAGARRKIDEERASASDELPFDDELASTSSTRLPADTRARIIGVRDELRSLLALLSRPRTDAGAATDLAPPVVADDGRKTAGKRSRRKAS
jgi:DNA-binding transcriptional MerR regulator